MNRKFLIALVIAPLLLCLCLGTFVVYGARAGGELADAKATQTAIIDRMQDRLLALCTGQAGAVAEAAPYSPGPGVHPVVAFRTQNTATFRWDSRIGTGDWTPGSLGEAELVACAEESWVTIESCSYKSEATGAPRTLDRRQHQAKMRLIAARSGQVVATETLLGTEPRQCEDKESFAPGATQETVSGEPVTPSAIQGWLRTFVAP